MAKLIFTDQYIDITCERGDDETRRLLSENIFPFHANRIGTSFRISIRKTPEILKIFRGIDESNIATAPQKIQYYYFQEMFLRGYTPETKGNPVVNSKLTLKPHQQLAREIAMVRNKFGFFYDTRTGKTPMSLAIMQDDIKKNPGHKWLVVCPLILIENAWLCDAKDFGIEARVVNCHAATKAKRIAAIQSDADIYITNTESFATYVEYFKDIHGVFVDESSSMKSASSKVSNALVDFSLTVKRWYLLSGTPAPNGEWEYYKQLQSIDMYGVPSSYSQFKNRYFTNLSYNPQYEDLVLRPDRKEELYKVLSDYCMYVDKVDVLDLPGQTFNEVTFELSAELKHNYDQMRRHMCLELSEEMIVAPSAAAKLNKLNQVTSGFIMNTQAAKDNKYNGTDREEIVLLSMERFDILKSLLDRFPGEQIIIWANYRKEFHVIKEMLVGTCACIYGETSNEEKNKAVQDFKTGKIQYLIANPASADKGLTLTNSHIAIYFSLNWSYETYKQSTDRIYADRSKQPKHCEYYIIMAKGTIDEILYRDVLQGKAEASYAILNHIKGV